MNDATSPLSREFDPYDNDFDARRVGLPVRAGGFGWRKLEDAFYGGACAEEYFEVVYYDEEDGPPEGRE